MSGDTIKVIEHPSLPSVVEVRMKGSTDHNNFQKVGDVFDGLRRRGWVRYILDCREIDFISSSGFGLFVNLAHEMTDKKGAVGLVGLSPDFRQVLGLLGAEDAFVYHEEPSAALRALARKLST